MVVAPSFCLGAVDAFLKIEGIEGPVVTKGVEGASKVFEFNSGLESPATLSTKGSTTKAVFHGMEVTKALDAASPILAQSCAAGSKFKQAVLTLVPSDMSSAWIARITMEDVTVSSCVMESGGSGVPQERILLKFARIVWEYRGESKEATRGSWNLLQNTQ